MNLSQLEVLVAIVETGSLTEAAEVVGLTQSAVSHSLSKLEAELGVTLLERGRQGVALTRIGADVLQSARSILSQVDVIRQKTARERGLSIGKLRFGCVSTVPTRLLTGIIRDFQHRYPDIDIVLFEGNPRELSNWLETAVVDVGIVLDPEGYAIHTPLIYDELKVIVAADHPFAAQSEVRPESLAGETLVGPRADYGVMDNLPGLDAFPHPRSRHEVSTYSTILAMIRENMGVALVPEMFIESGLEGIVHRSLIPRLFFQAHLVAPTASPAAEAFLASASSWAREHGFLPESS